MKQTTPQRGKKSVVLKASEGNDNLYRPSGKIIKKRRHIPGRSVKAIRTNFGRHPGVNVQEGSEFSYMTKRYLFAIHILNYESLT